jgi:Protein of unknown function (DUF2628)
MAVYTVHEPPLKRDQTAPDPERFVFVRDGFAFWAFLLAPLWMLRHRMWLVFFGYLVLTIALQVGLRALGTSPAVSVLVSLLIAWLVGLEAATLRRFTLARRRWKNVGIVVGDDREAVERRFFDAWADNSGADGARDDGGPRSFLSSAPALPILRRPQGSLQASSQAPGSSDVIGLFPEPGASR